MSFEPVSRSTRSIPEIPVGTCSIAKTGQLVIKVADLAAVEMLDAEEVAVLFDAASTRIAIRTVREDDPPTCRRPLKFNAAETSAHVSVASAISELGIDKYSVVGRHAVEHKDDLLIINLHGAKPRTKLQSGARGAA